MAYPSNRAEYVMIPHYKKRTQLGSLAQGNAFIQWNSKINLLLQANFTCYCQECVLKSFDNLFSEIEFNKPIKGLFGCGHHPVEGFAKRAPCFHHPPLKISHFAIHGVPLLKLIAVVVLVDHFSGFFPLIYDSYLYLQRKRGYYQMTW